jgi:predicted RNase H-like nuclease
MKFVGVDGCKAGWFWASISEENEWDAGIIASFKNYAFDTMI